MQELGDPKKAKILEGFFKTRPGEYGEGDRFLGVNVPSLRGIAKKYKELTLSERSTKSQLFILLALRR